MEGTNYAAKIAALLAKAESTDSPEEAEALSSAAERLMLKWGITEAMAAEAKAGATATEPVIERKQKQTGVYHQAWTNLANSIVLGLGSLRLLRSTWSGFGYAVCARLRAERRAVVEETTGSDLVLVGRAKRVDDAVADMYPKLGKGRASRMEGSDTGDRAGRAAGSRADLRGTRAVAG